MLYSKCYKIFLILLEAIDICEFMQHFNSYKYSIVRDLYKNIVLFLITYSYAAV